MFVELVHGRVVRCLDADQQRLRHKAGRDPAKDFLQHAGRDLAAAAAPVRKRRQAQRKGIGGIHGSFQRIVARRSGVFQGYPF
jgi:hypothetical protein